MPLRTAALLCIVSLGAYAQSLISRAEAARCRERSSLRRATGVRCCR